MLSLLALFLAFAAFSDSLYLAMRRLLRHENTLTDVNLFVLTRGLGPVGAAVAMYLLLLFFPRQSTTFYALGVPAFFAAATFFGRSHLGGLIEVYRRIPGNIATRLSPRRHPWFWIVLFLFSAVALGFGVLIPITEHDSLIAAMEGRILLRDLSLGSYLASSQGDPVSGFFYRSFRTPFLPCLYAWFGSLAGAGSQDLLARFVSPLYGIQTLLLLTWVVGRRWRPARSATWAVALLATTPIFLYMSYVNGVDPPRIYLSFLALVWLRRLVEPRTGLGLAVCTGVVFGWALFSHLITVLPLAGGVLAFLFIAKTTWPRKLVVASVLGLVAFLGGVQFHYLLHPDTRQQLVRNYDSTFLNDWAVIVENLFERDEQYQAGEEDGTATTQAALEAAPVAGMEPNEKVPFGPATESGQARAEDVGESARAGVAADASFGSPPAATTAPLTTRPRTPKRRDLAAARGHGGSPLSSLIFGRLQLLTGFEYFGLLFWLFLAAIVWRLRSRDLAPQDLLFLGACLLTAAVILSGLRKLSWSNPRYIGSLVFPAAYFAGPWLAELSLKVSAHRPRVGRWLVRGGWLALVFPLLLATGIRGAKIEITNTGSFYSDFRSLSWVGATLENPLQAGRTFWNDYLGIRRTFQYLFAETDVQLVNAHDFFGAVIYMKHHSPPDSRALLMRDARYFYYSERPGVVWFHPDISSGFRKAPTAQDLLRFLRQRGVTHVVIDEYSKQFTYFIRYQLDELLAADHLVDLIFEFGSAQVYLLGDATQIKAPESPEL